MYRWEASAAIADSRLIAIVRAADADEARRAVDLLLTAGVRTVEVSLTTPDAVEVIRDIAAAAPEGIWVGAGTVLDAVSARLAILAGARFLVCPAVVPAVLRTASRYGVATVPGAATPTEIVRALELGADFVKLFPASLYGPSGVRELLRAMPQAPLVPTGGVGVDNVADYLAAGAAAVGIGSSLTAGTPAEVRSRAADLLAQVSSR